MILFSQIGKVIAKQFYQMNESQKLIIFKLIEDGIESPNDELATAVTTGLIEAMTTEADNNFLLSRDLDVFFGEKSQGHALAWRNYGQK